jgi:type I restriction enzyme M protein
MKNWTEIINSIFNILKLENIVGLDAIRHCLIFIGYKNLTKETIKLLDIPSEYLFENFFKDKKGNTILDDNLIYKKFHNSYMTKQSLSKYVFNNSNFFNFQFKLESPTNLINILKKLNDLNLNELKENNIDVYGIVYQLYLDKCTTIQKKELSYTFTNRSLVKYMIELCEPKLNETILDPSCGTGGFLSMSYKYLNNKYSNIDWNIYKKNIYGFDNIIGCKSKTIGSLFLESGILFDKITCRDTLCHDYKIDNTLIEKVDIILCDEPYGIKNFKYATACPRIKQLKFDGTKAEPLFLQLILQSLNKNGRAAVIVPDNLLDNKAKLHTETRQYLVENLNLKKVINIDIKLSNLGVNQSILYFENNGKTQNVQFCKFDGFTEESIITVNYDLIKEKEYNLFLNKYKFVENLLSDNIENDKIKNMCIINKYNKNKDYISIDHDKNIEYNKNYENNLIIQSISENINLKFIYYYLKFNSDIISNLETVNNISIPILNSDVENKIISILDLNSTQIDLNNKSINNIKEIIKNRTWTSLFNKNNTTKLGDVTTIKILDNKYKINNNEDNIYVNKYGDIWRSNINDSEMSKKFIPYIMISSNKDYFKNEYIYNYFLYKENLKCILQSNTVTKSGIENINIPNLSFVEQDDLLEDIHIYNSSIMVINNINNNLKKQNIIDIIIKSKEIDLDSDSKSSTSANSSNEYLDSSL